MTTISNIWRNSARLNRDSSVNWWNLARDFVRQQWTEAAAFAADQASQCELNAQHDEQMAERLENFKAV